jgi:hypothetical protein
LNVEIGRLIKALKFLKICDYVACKGNIINEDSKIEAFRWNKELTCQVRFYGGGDMKDDTLSNKDNENCL